MSASFQQSANLTPEQKRALLEKLLREKAQASHAVHPLSYNQSSLWFMQRLEPDNVAYNLMAAWTIRSAVDIEALKRAFQALLNRHPSLRTTYAVQGEKPVQHVHAKQEAFFEILDAAGWSEEELDERMSLEAHRPFDLEKGPMLRVHLFLREEGRHVLVLSVHHLAVDGWSLVILFDELRQLYNAELTGTEAKLPPLKRTYAHFVKWQADLLNSAEGEAHGTYWMQQLGGELPVLNLPTDRPRPPVQSYRGTSHTFKLSEELASPMKELARCEGTTLYTVLLAAFQALLHRYSGQDDLIVGSFASGRSLAEFEHLVGYFVNPVALRADFTGKPSFRSLVQQMRKTTLDSLEHQEYPFPLLVEKLLIKRDPSHTPLFQAAFVLEKAQRLEEQASSLFLGGESGDALHLDGLVLVPRELKQQAVQFDLVLMIEEAKGALLASLQYNTDLFDEATIQRMSRHFAKLLAEAASDPDAPIASLPLLSEAEWQQQLVEWNDTKKPYPSERCMHHMLEIHAAERPDALACVFEERHYTYAELNERANQLARHLQTLGVGPDVLVGVCIDRSLEMMVAVFGVLKAGGAYLPLDPSYPVDRLDYMLTDSEVSVLLTKQRFVDGLPPHQANVVCIDADWDAIAQEQTHNLDIPVQPHNLAYMIYTSGSTGRPKGVLVEHVGIWNMADAQLACFDIDADSNILQFASFSFDAWGFECVMALRSGACFVLAPRDVLLPGPAMIDLLKKRRVTHATLPPSVLAALQDADLPDLRTIITAGEACSGEIVSRWQPGRRFFNAYGPSEATVWSTIEECFAGVQKPSIGRAIQNTQVYLLDSELNPVPVGVPGELHIGGVGLARGYHKRDDLTAEKFIPNPFAPEESKRLYKTGDLCRFLPDGTLDFLGRIDHQVKLRGFRIELGEIEALLGQHPAVSQSYLLVREDAPGNKQLVGYVTLHPGETCTGSELRALLKGQLPDYMVPSVIMVLDAMPLSPNGKVDRTKLPKPALTRDELDASYVAPSDEIEEKIAAIWGEVLGLKRVGAQDNFFDLGGHSLLATQLQVRVRETLQAELPLRLFFEKPTIASLALEVRKAMGGEQAEEAPIVPIPRGGQLEVSFAQQRMWFLDRLEAGNPAYHIPAALRLTGPLHIEAMEQSFSEIVRRHETLRTTFRMENGELNQWIASPAPHPLPVTDLSGLGESEREADIKRRVREEAARPFDLEKGPLLRTSLLRISEHEHVLLLTIHHIISDGWSMGLLLGELKALYEAHANGRTLALPELHVQYADFSHWQNRWLQGEVLDKQIAYWKQQLGGDLPVLDLPTDRPRPAVQTFRGAMTTLGLPKTLSERIKTLSQREGATLYMTLMAAFKVLLHRYTGLEDILLGSPIAGRTRKEVEPIIGFFINTLVLRTDLSNSPSFRETLKRVRETALGAFAHQDLPFEKLVEVVKPVRDLSRPPIFQVMFNMLNLLENKIEFAGLQTDVITATEIGSKFDMTLYAEERAEGLHFELAYNVDLFEVARMQELLQQLQRLLEQVVEQPDLPIARYSLVTPQAKAGLPDPEQALLEAAFEPVHVRVAKQAARIPERLAAADSRQRLTYAELEARSNRLANHLIAEGVAPQDRVAVYAQRSVSLVETLLAILKTGAAFLILDPAYPTERLVDRMTVAKPKALVCLDEAGALPQELAACETRVLRAAELVEKGADHAPQVDVDANAFAYVMFTSGTTGLPKGILGTHKPLAHFFDWHVQTHGLQETDRFSMLSGLAHDPLLRDIFTPLWVGATLCIPDHEKLTSPGYLRSWMEREQVTVSHLTPAMGQILTEKGTDAPLLSSLRCAFYGGDLLSRRDVAKLKAVAPAVTCVNFYGSTETPQAMGAYLVPENAEEASAGETLPIGRGIADVQLLVLNEAGQLAGIGEVGEVHVRTPYLSQGYLGDAEQTQEKFLANPFTGSASDRMYKTGDLGRYRLDGNIQLMGRRDGQVKIRGYRIELSEVQAVLAAHEAVREAVVTARPDEQGEPSLVAYLVAKPSASPAASELRQFVSDQLPDYMVPSAFVVLEAMPLTPNGKINYRALPSPERLRPEAEAAYVPPAGELEQMIAAAWQDVLNLPQVGMNDNFFDLGGHSLLMVRVCSRLQESLQREISMVEMFKYPTIRLMARYLEQQSAEAAPQSFDSVQDRAKKQKEAMNRQKQLRRGKK